MKITKKYLKNLIKEVKGDNSCPIATQEKEVNDINKGKPFIKPFLI